MTGQVRVLWFIPNKPEDISVGRQRIGDHLEANGIEVIHRGTTPQTVSQSLIHADEYDVVVGTTRAGALAGSLLKFLTDTPLVVDHVDPIRQFSDASSQWLATVVRVLENLAFHLANHVLYVYPEEKARVDRYAKAATKTDLGVEYEQFANPNSEVKGAARKRLEGLQLCENIAIYVGGLEPIYSVNAMLESVKYLSNWSLLVIGTGSLEKQVRETATLNSQIHYLGTVPHEQVPGYLHAADVGLSLVDDPYTLKVLEYGAARLPVVQLAGRSEARFGPLLTYCSPNPVNIAAGIEEATKKQSGDALREFVVDFDWKEIAKTYGEVIEAVVQDSAHITECGS